MGSKILIVDDEKEIADVVELYLKNENYQVVNAIMARMPWKLWRRRSRIWRSWM